METKVKLLHNEALLPQYGYPGDAGMDLSVVGDHLLSPGESRDLPTGVAVELPTGHWARITGRSSTLRKHGLFINEGVIDEGYRGELLVYVTNRQSTPVTVHTGDRLAQLILHPVVHAPSEWADELSPSDRGANGFGSTGGNGRIGDGWKPPVDLSERHEAEMVIPGYDVFADVYEGAYRAIKGESPPGRQAHPVYLGGAIDAAHGIHDDTDWRHSRLWGEAGIWTYCPKCECKGIGLPGKIIDKNMAALALAPVAVFDLRSESIGTPIEAWTRFNARKSSLIVSDRYSVFVDYMTRHPWAHLQTTLGGVGMLVDRVRALLQVEVSRHT